MKNILRTVLLFAVTVGYSQTTTKNYVKETTRRHPSTSPINVAANNHIATTTYYDALGRPVQVVDQNSSPDSNKNIVTHIEYEKNIGQTKEYLPFIVDGGNDGGGWLPATFHSNFVENGKNLTTSYYDAIYGTTPNPYSETRKEASPRQRVLEAGFPSDVWNINQYNGLTSESQRNTIRNSYALNTSNEVKRYNVTTSHSNGVYKNSISENGYYPVNSLTKTVVKNENWKTGDGSNNTVEEFKDVQGNVVLKRTFSNNDPHDTYYAYNKLNLLAFVIPPMANGTVLGDHLDKWCYQYHYDAKKRLVEKKLPQKDWEYIVYDKMDRVVMTGPVYNPFGDGSKGWLITKYDAFGRSVYTGYYAGSAFSSGERNTLSLNNFTIESKLGNNTTIDGITTRYTNTGFPTGFKLLSVNYYDDYSFPNAPTSFPTVETQTVNTAVKGQLTGSWTRVLTTASSTAGNVSYNLYDNKYRLIRSYSANHLGGYTQVDNLLNFTGTPSKMVTYQKQNSSAAVLTITNIYTYDRRDRLTKETQQIGTGTVETIVSNTYDPLGLLINKKVGNNSNSPLQDVDYNYNIRGWLTNINSVYHDPFAIGQKNRLFNYSILYNSTFNGDTSKPQYNGNISSVAWRTESDNIVRGYGYDYDQLNRLNYASHLKVTVDFFFSNYNRDGQYAEDVTYDKNGNITTLQRFGEEELGQPIKIDELSYSYNGNQLQSVTDHSSPTVNDGFKDVNKVGNDYVYDTFGNMTQDLNKGITAISYNHLNLPFQVTFNSGSTINYIYDADGNRLSKKVQPSGGSLVTTDYVNGFQYENNVLQFFPHAEGYVKRNTNNTYLYVYQYKDHLGNIRLSYADVNANGTIQPASEILEENNYYPFGLKHKGYNEVVNSNRSEAAEKYKFLGKEFEGDLGFDVTAMDFRKYDGAIGRFFSMDAISEASVSLTPYHYGYNNPVFWSDPTGLLSDSFINSIWNSSGRGVTNWSNEGGYFRSNRSLDAFGNAFNVYNDGTVEESLSPIVIETTRSAFRGGNFNAYALGSFSLDKQIQHHVYTTANLYQGYRDGIREQQWNDFQRDLDYMGMAPGIGEPIDLINAGISAIRGNYVEAGLGLGAMIPVAGNFFVGAKHLNRISKYEKLADGFGTRAYIKEFNNTTTINTKILFNDITQGGTKKIIKTPQGNIINATMSDGSIIQLRNFSTKSGSVNHSTIQFIGTQNKWKFNY